MHPIVLRAKQLTQAGRWPEAFAELKSATVHEPQNAALLHGIAVLHAERGEFDAASQYVLRAIALVPNDASVLLTAAGILHDAGKLEQAFLFAGQIDASSPLYSKAQNRMGLILVDLGRLDEAIVAFRRALEHDSNYMQAFGNLAAALLRLGRPQEACLVADQALVRNPAYGHASFVKAQALLGLGAAGEAIGVLAGLVERQPKNADALLMLARLQRQQLALTPAIDSIRQLLVDNPDSIDGLNVLGDLLATNGQTEDARNVFKRVMALSPQNLEAAIRYALLLPVVYESTQHLESERAAFERNLDTLCASAEDWKSLPANDLLKQIQYTNFYLAYQGRDDRQPQEKYAEFLKGLLQTKHPETFKAITPRAIGTRKIRIGFASRFFHVSTAGNYFASWILDLPRSQFEVSVFPLHTHRDALTAMIRSRADHFAEFEPDLDALATKIQRAELDVLVYPELGMDARTYLLAAFRLAPVQVAGWGHPVTSGHANIDYFFSCDAMEPPNAKDHYCERLVLLPGLGTRYSKPQLEARNQQLGREAFQLPAGKCLYLVPQSLFKIHPDNDALLVNILARNENGVLVFFAGQAQAALQRFIARLQNAFAAVGLITSGRVKILPDLSHQEYLRVNRLCDVMLDTLHWSGGNTSLDAIASGLPIVTLPGLFMRGRQSAAMLRLIGLEDLVAQDQSTYVDLAVRLGSDPDFRQQSSKRLVQNSPRLFDDPAPTAAFADRILQIARNNAV